MISKQITSPAGITLHTSGKFCDDDIAVVPALQTVSVTPTETAQAITPGSGYAGLAKVEVAPIPSDYAPACKKWTITIPAAITSGTAVLLTDAWLAQHREDDNLVVACVADIIAPTNRYSSAYFVAGNKLFSGTDSIYGVGLYHGSAYSPSAKKSPLKTEAKSVNTPFITADGSLSFKVQSSYPLEAGTYHAIAWLA